MSDKKRLPKDVSGQKGGKGGSKGASRAAVEAPNTLQSRATARVIDIVSHGECIGLANREDILKSIFYDGLPIKNSDGSFNWQGVQIQERLGLPGQDPFVGFDEIEDETAINLEITTLWPRTIRVSDNSVDALRVKIRLPSLTSQNKTNGDMNGTYVSYRFDVRPVDGTWQTVAVEYLNAKCTTAQELSYRIERPDNALAIAWEMRVVRTTPDTTDVSIQNKTWLASVTQLIDAKLQYADLAGIAQLADSEQFGDSIPPRSFDWVGMVLDVPTNYTPPNYNDPLNQAQRQYAGLWNGTFKRAWTDNPAWVLWGLLTNKEWGLGRYISPNQVDKWELYQIAKYCDEFVSDGFGGMEPRYRINTQITKAESAYAVLQAVASIFRGMIYWGSGTVSFVYDGPKDSVKLVSPANVLDGEFSYTSTALKSRRTAARVTWNDPSDNFTQAIEVVEDPEMIDRYGYKPADVTAFGCVSRGEANRMGRWLLDTERYENETVTYRASFDHADVRPGQIIEIYDPHYAGVRMGGRIKSVASTNVVLDAPVTIEAGNSYSITLVKEDGTLVSRDITNALGETDTLTWSGSIGALPSIGNVLVFATATATQHSSIIDITTTSVKLTSDLFIDEKYNYFIGFTLPDGSVVSRQISPSSLADALTNEGQGREFSWTSALPSLPNKDSIAFVYAPAEGWEERSVSASTATTANISMSYTFREGYDYEVLLSYTDGTRTVRKLTNGVGTSAILQWSDPTNALPVPGSMWGLTSSSLSPREFRVLGVKELDPNVFEITALLYDRNKYARVEQDLLLDPGQSSIWTSTEVPAPPTDITAYRRPVIIDGVMTEKIQVFWEPSPSQLVTHYRVGYRFADGEFIKLTDTHNTSFEIDSRGKGDYTFIVTAVNIAGKESKGAVRVLTLDGRGLDSPTITNIRLAGNSFGVTEFTGPDLSITWDVSVPENWWDPSGGGSDPTINSWEDPYRKDYVVKVQKTDGSELRTFYVTDRRLTLDRVTNSLIGDNSGLPRRALKISIAMRDVENVIHEFTDATFNNSPPAPPALVTLGESLGVVSVTVPPCPDYDYASTFVWVSTTNNFDPLTTAPTFTGNQTQFVFNGEYETTYFVRVAYVDTFSEAADSTSISSQYSITTDVLPLPDLQEVIDAVLVEAEALIDTKVGVLETGLQEANDRIDAAETDLGVRIDAINAANLLKNRTFLQAEAPTNPQDDLPLTPGDLWIDSDDNNTLRRWSGLAWDNVTSAGVRTFAQNDAPTTQAVGDLWFDTDNDMLLSRWSGTAWVEVVDGRVSDLQNTVIDLATSITDLETGKASVESVTQLQSLANLKNRSFAQSVEPANPSGGVALVAGDLWMDTDDDNKIYRFSGGVWASVHDMSGQTALDELTDARGSEVSLGARITTLQTTLTDAISGKAEVTEFNSLKTEVETARGSASSLSNRLTNLSSSIDGKAEAAVVTELAARRAPIQNLAKKSAITGATVVTENPGFGSSSYAINLNDAAETGSIAVGPLKQGVKYSLSFKAKTVGATSQSINVDLFPDTLPQSTYNVTSTAQTFIWDGVSSAHVDMLGSDVLLRFFQPGIPAGVTVLITDWMLTESAIAPSGWTAAPEDADSAAIGDLSAQLLTAQNAIVDLENSKAEASEFSSVKAEVEGARNGSPNLGAQLGAMRTAYTDGLNSKAEASQVSTIEAKVTVLDKDRLAFALGGSVADAPSNFTNTLVGRPDTVTDMASSSTATITDALEGQVVQIAGVARHVSSKGWIPIGSGRTHRVTARVKVDTDGLDANRTGIGFRLTNDAALNGGGIIGYTTMSVADGWMTIQLERTSEQMKATAGGPGSTHFRPNVFMNVISSGITTSGATTSVAWLRYEDVTLVTLVGARVSTVEQAAVDLATGKADATRVTDLEARTNVQPNLIPNGNFELGNANGWLISGATYSNSPDVGGGIVSHNVTVVTNRYWHSPVANVSTGSAAAYSAQLTAVIAMTGGYCQASVVFYSNVAGTDAISQTPWKNITTGRWVQENFTKPAGAVSARILFAMNPSATGGSVLFRMAKLEAGPVATAYNAYDTERAMNARLTTVETVTTNGTFATASSVSSLEASVNGLPNLLLNSDFSNGTTSWVVTGTWSPLYDVAFGSMMMSLGGTTGGDWDYVWQDVVLHSNTQYTLSWTGEGGAGPVANVEVYVESKNAAGTVLSTGGPVQFGGGNFWNSRKTLTFATHASATYVRIIFRKKATTAHNVFLSRIMLTVGSTAPAWSNQAEARASSARISVLQEVSATKDELNAKYGVILNAGNVVTGFQISATANSSTFDVLADRFRITNGTNTAAPFEVSGGIVRIKQANMGLLSASNIVVGTLTQNMTVGSGAKIQIDGANNRILISD